jgi:hypothetical protein
MLQYFFIPALQENPGLLLQKVCLQQKGAPLTLPAMLDPS